MKWFDLTRIILVVKFMLKVGKDGEVIIGMDNVESW